MDREPEILKTINITVSRCYLRLAIRQFTQLNNSPLHTYINRNQACQTIDQLVAFFQKSRNSRAFSLLL